MTPAEPVYEIAHLGRVELLTPDIEGSLRFFVDVLGMSEVERTAESVLLRAWGDYQRASLQLTSAERPGIGTTSWRTTSDAALERRAAAVEASGRGEGWTDGLAGHGRTYRFSDPDGHRMAIDWTRAHTTSRRRQPCPDAQEPTGADVDPRRRRATVARTLNANVWCRDIDENSRYMIRDPRLSDQRAGARRRRPLSLGTWLHVTPKSYHLAYGRNDPTGVGGRLHHVAYAVDARDVRPARGRHLHRLRR